MSVAIREVRAEDWSALFGLWVEAWTAFMPEIDFVARLPGFRDHVAALQRKGAVVLVADPDDGGPVGFATIDARRQDLDQLVTALGAQRRGVGRSLVRAAQARSPAGVSLIVNQRNTRAIRLYHSEGFVTVAEGTSAASGLPTFHMRWPGRPQP